MARAERAGRVQPLRLHFEDTTQVVVLPDDNDRFVTTVAEAAKACQLGQQAQAQRELFEEQFKKFLALVHTWARSHKDDVRQVYVAPMPHGIEVVVVTNSQRYKFDFDDVVTALDLDIVKKFPDYPAHVMQLPNDSDEELRSFFSPDRAFQVYGQ